MFKSGADVRDSVYTVKCDECGHAKPADAPHYCREDRVTLLADAPSLLPAHLRAVTL